MRNALAIALLAGGTLAASANPTAILQDSGFGANSFADSGMTIQFDRFDRPNKSGTGSHWVMLARNTTGTSSDAMVITGSGLTYNLAALEGTTAFEPGRTFDTSDRYMDINESGDWVAIGNLVGGANDDDEVVYRGNFDGSVLSLPFREGQVIGTGDTLGTSNYGPSITDSGAVAFGYGTLASSSDVSYFTNNGNTAVLRNGGSVTGSATAFSTASFGGRNAFQTTSDGSSYVVIGNLGSSSGTQVLVKDGAIVLRAGDAFAGSTVANILGEQNILQDNGDWLTRARLADGRGVAIKNGSLLAASGDLVGGSVPGETWSELPWTSSSDSTFAIVTGDSAGNVVLGGFTDNADTSRNFVWTYNGVEFLRSGDQIDLDADGILDDAFIFTSSFTTASPEALGGFLADDGYFYTVISYRNAADTFSGDAFIRVAVPAPASLALLALGGLTATRRRR